VTTVLHHTAENDPPPMDTAGRTPTVDRSEVTIVDERRTHERRGAAAPSRVGAIARVDAREVIGVTLHVLGVLLVAYVVFQLAVTPLVNDRAQRDLAGELESRIDTAAALASGGVGLEGGSADFVFGDTDPNRPEVPDLRGQVPADATRRLEQLGFTVALAPEVSRDLIPGLVARTDPPAADRREIGGTVTVFVATVAPGSPVATLRVDKIGLSEVVVEGTTSELLMEGPGHYRDSPAPGQAGNAVIFGRRTTYGAPFGRLDELQPGDKIRVGTLAAELTYSVAETKTVRPGDDDVLSQSSVNVLTLVTAHPAFQASERLVVVATLEGEPIGVSAKAEDDIGTAVVLTPDELGRDGDATAWAPALLWAELLAIAVVVTRRLTRGRSRPTAWLLAAPVIVMLAVLFFESANRLLPSTL